MPGIQAIPYIPTAHSLNTVIREGNIKSFPALALKSEIENCEYCLGAILNGGPRIAEQLTLNKTSNENQEHGGDFRVLTSQIRKYPVAAVQYRSLSDLNSSYIFYVLNY